MRFLLELEANGFATSNTGQHLWREFNIYLFSIH